MKKFVLVIALLALVIVLVACASPAPDDATPAPPLETGPVTSSATIDGVTHLLTLPSGSLVTGTSETIQYMITNSTDATISITSFPHMTVTKANGVIVVDTIPPGARFLAAEIVNVSPGATWEHSWEFTIPALGTCTIALPDIIDFTGRTLALKFESVSRS